jgi:hypothetical protein
MGMMETVQKYAEIAERIEYLRNEPRELERQRSSVLEEIAKNKQSYEHLSLKARLYATKLRTIHSQEKRRTMIHIYTPGQYFSKEEQAELREVMTSLEERTANSHAPLTKQAVIRDKKGKLRSVVLDRNLVICPVGSALLGAFAGQVMPDHRPLFWSAACAIPTTALFAAAVYAISPRNASLDLAKRLESKAKSIDAVLNEAAKSYPLPSSGEGSR